MVLASPFIFLLFCVRIVDEPEGRFLVVIVYDDTAKSRTDHMREKITIKKNNKKRR
jgi:hypothetical protein